MKVSVNMVLQLAALIAQAANQVYDLLPEQGKFWAAVTIAAAQGITGVLAHFVNPDGTSAKKPYVKKEK